MSPLAPFGQRNLCENRNHTRANSPVRHCPQCGDVVNQNVRLKQCSENEHAALRRHQNKFCLDCGVQLIAALR
jgi:hypothetical protein